MASDIAIDVAWRTELPQGMDERSSSSSASIKRAGSDNDEVVVYNDEVVI